MVDTDRNNVRFVATVDSIIVRFHARYCSFHPTEKEYIEICLCFPFCRIFDTGKSTTIPVVIISTAKVRFITLFQAKLTFSSPKAHHAICENEQAVDAGYR